MGGDSEQEQMLRKTAKQAPKCFTPVRYGILKRLTALQQVTSRVMFARLSGHILSRRSVTASLKWSDLTTSDSFQFHFLKATMAGHLPLTRPTATATGNIDIEDMLKKWESNVDEEGLSDDHKAIHKEHLKAVKVST